MMFLNGIARRVVRAILTRRLLQEEPAAELPAAIHAVGVVPAWTPEPTPVGILDVFHCHEDNRETEIPKWLAQRLGQMGVWPHEAAPQTARHLCKADGACVVMLMRNEGAGEVLAAARPMSAWARAVDHERLH